MGDFKEWAKVIRSTVMTSKTPLTPYEINRDVKLLEGCDIPYRKLNFNSLEEMLRNIPNLQVVIIGNRFHVKAIPTEETAHIAKLVSLQKSSKKKTRRMIPNFSNRVSMQKRTYNNYNNNYNNYNSNSRNMPCGPKTNFDNNRFNVPNRSNSFDQSRRTSPKAPARSMSVPYPSQQNNYQQPAANQPLQPQKETSPTSKLTSSMPKPTKQQSSEKPVYNPKPMPSLPVPKIPSLLKTAPSVIPATSLPQKAVQFVPTPLSQRLQPPQPLMSIPVQPPTLPIQQLQQGSSAVKTTVQERLKLAQQPRVQQPQLQEPVQPRVVPSPVDDPRLRLHNYTEAKGLPFPEYKLVSVKKSNSIFSSVIVKNKVGEKKYSSYPQEAKSEEEAHKLAAQAALDNLLNEDKRPSNVTHDRNLIKQRIVQIVNEHPNGIFQNSLVETYFANHDESLPENWLKFVEPFVIVDGGVNNLTILSPRSSIQVDSRPTSPTSTAEIPALRLEHLEQFWLQVYVVYSTDDVWGVIIDEEYSDRIDELAKEMKDFYSSNFARPTISKGKYYAVLDSEWHRVLCLDVDSESEMVKVFFVDRGDEDEFSMAQLRDLPPRFCTLPAQAVRVSMTGLETFNKSDRVQSLLEEMLIDKAVFIVQPKLDQGCVSAQLYFEDNDEISVNEMVHKEILDKLHNPLWYLETTKVAQEAYISCIRGKEVYVQVKLEGLEYLEEFTEIVTERYLDNKQVKRKLVASFEKNKRYFVKSPEDGEWCRVEIHNIKNSEQASVFCIDTGDVFSVRKSELVLIEDWSELLAKYPAQAVKVQLHKISPITFDEKMAAYLREIAPKTELFYMKTVGKEGIPIVEFSKRMENNFIVSLNDTLVFAMENSPKDDNNNASNNSSRRRSDRSSLGARYEFPLKPPVLAPVDDYCDIHVTMAAHPGNFTFQPLGNQAQLAKMMDELKEACQSYNGPAVTSVKVGNMCAVKYEDDDRWYRAYVSKVLGKSMAAVYYCDYGDYRAVTLDQLQPLQNQFFDLPYQAVKAKLYGVQPVLKGDWTVKDSLRFNELIVGKDLVLLLKSYIPDNISSGETVVTGYLYDTSDLSNDLNIAKILIDEKRAEEILEKNP